MLAMEGGYSIYRFVLLLLSQERSYALHYVKLSLWKACAFLSNCPDPADIVQMKAYEY